MYLLDSSQITNKTSHIFSEFSEMSPFAVMYDINITKNPCVYQPHLNIAVQNVLHPLHRK